MLILQIKNNDRSTGATDKHFLGEEPEEGHVLDEKPAEHPRRLMEENVEPLRAGHLHPNRRPS
ncbi:MAG: hypothetical protein JNM82_03600 [Rhodocyclaceae bacterium]|nr:hypothetical protein [Rhodocyclaceae bacterium]